MAWYLGPRNVQTCMRVVLCQTKNGLPSFFALSMKSVDALTSTSSKVVMSYLAFGVMSCMFGTLDMSGKGAKGPSSSIFCLPTLPQRGCSVGSSVVGRPAVDQIAGADFVAIGLIIREGVPIGIRHRIEVI